MDQDSAWSHITLLRKQMCNLLLAKRRLVNQQFSLGPLEGPGWAILLDLYAAEMTGERLSLSALWAVTQLPKTSAKRCTDTLVQNQVLERHPAPKDRRCTHMRLSPSARETMDNIMDRLIQQIAMFPSEDQH